MSTRKQRLQEIVRASAVYYQMYGADGIVYFRNETQISKDEYDLNNEGKPAFKEKPLFYELPENNTKNTRNEK